MCSELSAQFNISVTGGLNYSRFNSILWGRKYFNEFDKFYKFQVFPNLGFEISYKKNNFSYMTGLSYSYRGTRDYYVFPPLFKNGFAFDIDGYIEVPLQVSYHYFKNHFSSGVGIVLHDRLYNGSGYSTEVNKIYGIDLRVTSSWNIDKHFAIVPSFTLGNFDKYVSNTFGNFLHHVFALNLRYTFYSTDKNISKRVIKGKLNK